MVALFDWFNKILPKAGEKQTAALASHDSDIGDHPSRGLTPTKLATILEDAERGNIQAQCDLFADMEEKDGHIFAEISKRRRAILSLPWNIVPPDDASAAEEQVAADIKDQIESLELDDILLSTADAIGHGFSCQEIEWQRHDGDWWPMIEHQLPRIFTVHNQREIRLRTTTPEGTPLRPGNWITHIHKTRPGIVSRSGLYRTLAWPYLFKNYSVRDLAEFLEIYGLPVRLGTYPSGATKKERGTLLRAVMGIGHDAAGIVPEGMSIDFKEAAKGGKDPFEFMMEWCEKTESKVILGQTLSSQADGKTSTNALGNVHMEVMRDLLESDAIQIQRTLTRDLVMMLTRLNTSISDPRRIPRFVFELEEPEDLKLYSEALPKLVGIGMQIPRPWAQKKLAIPEPEPDEEVLASSSRSTGTPNQGTPAKASLKSGQAERDVADDYTDQLEAVTDQGMGTLLEPVRRLVMSANSLEEIRDGLIALYPNMDDDDLVEQFRTALAATDLAGRFEVDSDN